MMKQSKHYLFFTYLLVWCVLLFSIAGCSDDSSNGDNSNLTEPDKIGDVPGDPGPGNLAGIVIGTLDKQTLQGVTVSVNSRSAITGSDGTFLLTGVGEGILAVVISGSNIYTRTQAVNTADGRSVVLDVLEQNSSFDLTFYREIARGNHPLERDLFPTHRWTSSTPPTFYINTNGAAANDGVIDQEDIDTVASVLRQITPVFTNGFYSSINIETAYFSTSMRIDDIPDNSFVISFDDSLIESGAYGLTYTQPDFISPTTSTIQKSLIFIVDDDYYYQSSASPERISFEEIIAHESGHGFGFRHTSEPSYGGFPSVMVKTGKFGGTYSEYDRLHMGVVYQRPAGNTDLDNDPVPTSSAKLRTIDRLQVFLDQRLEAFDDLERAEKTRSIQGFDIVKELIAEYDRQ
ncbi:hypothetical protein CSA56_15640 [candidate division KSB3 bacterium]|uniref:Peptidase M10 metallopeptidase domain-containing protein n=1 Tax=candidate division KSB3 bacterium TaxID=2044937 RepID=A0A2G6KCA5_9BACT|nr:MAG: hypothetical protein CSA56_15640 [candidate division KSB3 bacterium]